MVDTRDCRLYRFYGLDPRTNYTTKTLLYIGETVRQPFDRLLEHLRDQPWFDTVTSWEVDDRVFAGKDAVLAAELAAIQAERPLYNVKGNEENRLRIRPWEAQAQRARRDAEAGRAPWTPPRRETVAAPQRRAPRRPRRRVASLRAWQVTAACWVGAWLLLAAMLWDALGGWQVSPTVRAWTTLLGPLAALSWGTWQGPKVWRRLKQRLR